MNLNVNILVPPRTLLKYKQACFKGKLQTVM